MRYATIYSIIILVNGFALINSSIFNLAFQDFYVGLCFGHLLVYSFNILSGEITGD